MSTFFLTFPHIRLRGVVSRGTFHLATIFRLKFRKFSMSKGKAQFPCGGNTCKLTGRSKHEARWRKTDANVRPSGGNGLEMGICASNKLSNEKN